MTFVLTPGQRHETVAPAALLDQGGVKRPGRLAGDRGYASRTVRQRIQRRNLVDRLINQCKQFRRVATRYEKVSGNYRRWSSSPLSCSGSDFADTP